LSHGIKSGKEEEERDNGKKNDLVPLILEILNSACRAAIPLKIM
jgi:hypothetical protein